METSVLPSPVFISAIQPKCSARPPISCTSKWRWPSTRQAASRTTAKASTARSSRDSPFSSRSLNSTVMWASASSLMPCISGSRAPIRGTNSASRLTFLPSPARRTFVNTLMEGRSYRSRGGPSRQALWGRVGLRAADLVFDPTLACREGDAPAPAARRHRRTQRHHLARIASSPPAPDSRGRSGQGLPLSRTMLSDHKSPYVGRFACDWPRLSTTDPHAARAHARARPALLLLDGSGAPTRNTAGPGRVTRAGDVPHRRAQSPTAAPQTVSTIRALTT